LSIVLIESDLPVLCKQLDRSNGKVNGTGPNAEDGVDPVGKGWILLRPAERAFQDDIAAEPNVDYSRNSRRLKLVEG
jgi:hypothetical protein